MRRTCPNPAIQHQASANHQQRRYSHSQVQHQRLAYSGNQRRPRPSSLHQLHRHPASPSNLPALQELRQRPHMHRYPRVILPRPALHSPSLAPPKSLAQQCRQHPMLLLLLRLGFLHPPRQHPRHNLQPPHPLANLPASFPNPRRLRRQRPPNLNQHLPSLNHHPLLQPRLRRQRKHQALLPLLRRIRWRSLSSGMSTVTTAY